MAFSLRIVAKSKNGQTIVIEPSWWNTDELRMTYIFKKEVDNYYLDYFLNIDVQTFQNIMESQEKYRNKGIFGYQGWIEVNNRRKTELDNLIQNLQEDSTIKIWIYEWESGLD